MMRSLSCFKCVCKSWLSLISHPQFTRSHFEVVAARTHRLIFRFSRGWEVNSIDIEAPLHDDYANVIFKSPVGSLFNMHVWRLGKYHRFSQRILFMKECIDYIDFITWNLSTGLLKLVYTMKMYGYLCGFRYEFSDGSTFLYFCHCSFFGNLFSEFAPFSSHVQSLSLQCSVTNSRPYPQTHILIKIG